MMLAGGASNRLGGDGQIVIVGIDPGQAGGDMWVASPAAIDAWLETAKPGDEYVYAQATMLPKCEAQAHVFALHQDGEVNPTQRKRGRLYQYLIQRSNGDTKPAKRGELTRRVRDDLGDESERLLNVLRWLAGGRRICPSNAELAVMARLRDRHQAAYQIKRLTDAMVIRVDSIPGPARTDGLRIVTIVETGKCTGGRK